MFMLPPWNDPVPLRCLFVRNMVLDANIGIFAHEQGVTQRIRVNVAFGVPDDLTQAVGADELARTVSYERVVLLVRELVAQGHVGWWKRWPNESPPPCWRNGGFASRAYASRNSTSLTMPNRWASRSSVAIPPPDAGGPA